MAVRFSSILDLPVAQKITNDDIFLVSLKQVASENYLSRKATLQNFPIANAESGGLMSKDQFNKLDKIEEGATKYVLPNASATRLGGIKVGANLTIDNDGVLAASKADAYVLPAATSGALGGIKIGYTELTIEGGKNYAVKLGTDTTNKDKAYVTIPTAESYLLPTASNSTLGGIKTGYTRFGNNYNITVVQTGNTKGQAYAYVPNATLTDPGTMSSADKTKLDQVPEPSIITTIDLIPELPVSFIEECEELISAGKTDFIDTDILSKLKTYIRIKYTNGLVEYNIRTAENVGDFTIPFYDFINSESVTFSTAYVFATKQSDSGNAPRISQVTNNDFFVGCSSTSTNYSIAIQIRAIITTPSKSDLLINTTLSNKDIAYYITTCFTPNDLTANKQRILVRITGTIENNNTNSSRKSYFRIFLYRQADKTSPTIDIIGTGIKNLITTGKDLRKTYTGSSEYYKNIYSNTNNGYYGIGYKESRIINKSVTLTLNSTEFPLRIGIECCDRTSSDVNNNRCNTCNFNNLKVEVYKIGIA